MTHLILRSRITDEAKFAQSVESHINELKAYQAHMETIVRNNGDYYPPPTMHPDVSAAIRRPDLVADYKFVDFIPIQKGDINALNLRKQELREKVSAMETAAIHTILPPGKWRLSGLKHAAASNKLPEDRTDADKAAIAEHEQRLNKVQEIQLHHAQMESEIEDLTFDTVNDWFPRSYQS